MSSGKWLAFWRCVWFRLGAGKHRHYFPDRPAEQGLRVGECYHCRRKFIQPYPVRGCRGRP